MKILFYNHTHRMSGAEQVLLTTLARLDRDRFTPVALCPAGDGKLKRAVEDLGVECQTTPEITARFGSDSAGALRACASIARGAAALRRRVRRSRPDLIHANSIRAGLVATLATAGTPVPVVWHLHDLLPEHSFSRYVRRVAVSSKRARLLAISEAVRANFVAGDERLDERSRVILNGIEARRFERPAGEYEATRRALDLASAHPVIGIVGHLADCKGQRELLDAFALVRQRLPRARLVVVGAELFRAPGDGSQSYEAVLRERAARPDLAGGVLFLGARSDVPELMGAFDLLVVNSRAEPFGLVALEAMASGVPVIATRAGGLPEIITHDETGWLVPPGDARALAESILRSSRDADLRRAISMRARSRVAERFGADRYIEELESFYQEIAVTDLARGGAPASSRRTEAEHDALDLTTGRAARTWRPRATL